MTPTPTETPTPTPTDIPPRETAPADRIRWIAREMAALRWPAYPASIDFRRQLAERWGCAEGTIRGYASDASRALAIFDPDERDMLRHELAVRLSQIADRALAERHQVSGLPDFQSAIKATDLMGKYLGLEPVARVEHSGMVALDSLDELRARIAGVAAETLRIDETHDPEHEEEETPEHAATSRRMEHPR